MIIQEAHNNVKLIATKEEETAVMGDREYRGLWNTPAEEDKAWKLRIEEQKIAAQERITRRTFYEHVSGCSFQSLYFILFYFIIFFVYII